MHNRFVRSGLTVYLLKNHIGEIYASRRGNPYIFRNFLIFYIEYIYGFSGTEGKLESFQVDFTLMEF